MKKRLQLPIGLIRMAFVAFAFLFFAVGCEKEEVSTSPFTTQENLEQENFSITGAKQWFESNIDSKLNANNVLENSTCWNFMASPDRKLNWENAYEYATATSNIIELSISYENGKRPGLIIKRDNSINLEDATTSLLSRFQD